MRVSGKLTLIAVGALMLVAAPARAQRAQARQQGAAQAGGDNGPMEVGIDAGLGFGLESPTYTLVQLPVGRVRLGFPLSPAWTLEPTVSFQSFSQSGGSTSFFDTDVGLLYHFSTARSQQQLFVRPFLALHKQTDVDAQFGLGAGIGMKWPVIANRMSTRGEIQLGRLLATNQDPGQTTLNFLFGLTFFVR